MPRSDYHGHPLADSGERLATEFARRARQQRERAPSAEQYTALRRRVETIEARLAEPFTPIVIPAWDNTVSPRDFINVGRSVAMGVGIEIRKIALSDMLEFRNTARMCYDAYVNADGSGTHTTIQAAITAVMTGSSPRMAIWVCPGTYSENLTFPAVAGSSYCLIESATGYYVDPTLLASGAPTPKVIIDGSTNASPTIDADNVSILHLRGVMVRKTSATVAPIALGSAATLFEDCVIFQTTTTGTPPLITGVSVNGVRAHGSVLKGGEIRPNAAEIHLLDCSLDATTVNLDGFAAGPLSVIGCRINMGASDALTATPIIRIESQTGVILADNQIIVSGGGAFSIDNALPDHIVIANNTISSSSATPGNLITLRGVTGCTVTGNVIEGHNVGPAGVGINLVGGTGGICGAAVIGNSFVNLATGILDGGGTITGVFEPNAFCSVTTTISPTLPGSGIDHGGLAGLGDDDHTQYVLHSILTTRGDIFVRDAATTVRLAVGAAGSILRSDGTDPAWTINPTIAGYGRFGSVAAPLNTTAGDLTVGRLIVGVDETLASGTILNVRNDYGAITAIRVATDIDVSATPSSGSGTLTGLRAILDLDPTANLTGWSGVGLNFTVQHTDPTFAMGTLTGVLGIVSSYGSATAIRGFQATMFAVSGTIETVEGMRLVVGSIIDGATITDFTGLRIGQVVGAATVTNRYSIWVDAVTGASGNNVAIRNDGNEWIASYLRVGASAAPTNVTAGDLTTTRIFATSGVRIGSEVVPTVALDVTGSTAISVDLAVTGTVTIGDTNFALQLTGGNPLITADAGDNFTYVRAGNTWTWNIATNQVFSVTASFVDFGRTAGGVAGRFNSFAGAGGAGAQLWLMTGNNADQWVVEVQPSASQDAIQFRASGATSKLEIATNGIRMADYLRVGSVAAPTNVTAGDLTAVRASIGSATQAFGSAVEFLYVTGTVTNPSASADVGVLIQPLVTVTIASTSDYRGMTIQTINTASSSANLAQQTALRIDNRFRSSAGLTTAGVGIDAFGIVFDSASVNFTTIAAADAIRVTPMGRITSNPIGTITIARGLLVQDSSSLGTGPLTLPTQVGVDIASLTRGVVNIGLRNASPTVFTPSAAQNITAVGATILANATVVQLTADASYTLTSTPTIADGQDGQMLTIINTDLVDTITLQDEAVAAGTNLRLSGGASYAMGPRDVLTICFSSSLGDWIEKSRSNN